MMIFNVGFKNEKTNAFELREKKNFKNEFLEVDFIAFSLPPQFLCP